MDEQRYNSIHTGQQIDEAVTWLRAHANDQIFGGAVSPGTIPTPTNPTYWLASAGTYTCGANTFVIPSGGVGIISYANNQWSCMAVGGVEIVDNCTTGGSMKALSAEQGKMLYGVLTTLESLIEGRMVMYDISFITTSSTITAEQHTQIYNAYIDKNYMYSREGVVISVTSVAGGRVILIVIDKGTSIRTYTISKDGNTSTVTHTDVDLQQKLVSGSNIKTINHTSLLGSGNINIQGGGGTGNVNLVRYNDYDTMIADHSQDTGTIGFESEKEYYYIYVSENDEWLKLADFTPIDVSWWFVLETASSTVLNRIDDIIATGRLLVADTRPVIVTETEDRVTLCILTDRNRVYLSVERDGYQVSGGQFALPLAFKTINGSIITTSGNLSLAEPVSVVEVTGTTPTQELQPNTFYKFGSVTSLNVTLAAGATGMAAIYAFSFTAGQANPTVTLPQGVVCNQTLSLAQGDKCEFSIMDNLAVFQTWT